MRIVLAAVGALGISLIGVARRFLAGVRLQ
jgi:hypothetical protein